ncbi:MAG: hypothetical protein JSR77_03340 [Planctomycetes bacterium]|nr:hypothetical protein [Planctomycetota bacterium]
MAASVATGQGPVLLEMLTPACPEYNASFGTGLSSNYDGSVIAVGAPNSPLLTSSVHILERTGDRWLPQASITENLTTSQFGSLVFLSSDAARLMIFAPNGYEAYAGRASVYRRNGGMWQSEASLQPLFDTETGAIPRLAVMNADGNAVFNTNSVWWDGSCCPIPPFGAVSTLVLTSGGWINPNAPIHAVNDTNWDRFGAEIGISGDGQIGVFTFQHRTLGYCVVVYGRQGNTWTMLSGPQAVGNGIPDQVKPIVVSQDGSVFALGVTDFNSPGKVRIFSRSGSSWQPAGPPLAAPAGWQYTTAFGQSTALSLDGRTLLAGYVASPLARGVVVYSSPDGWSWNQTAILQRASAQSTTFGNTLALSGDGGTAFIGAPGDDNGAGAVFAYALNAPISFTQQPQTITVNRGRRATFTVAAASNIAVTYRWRRNGMPLADGPLTTGAVASGSDSPTLTIFGTTLDDDGSAFDCIATNALGSTTSSIADLNVVLAPADCLADINGDGGIDGTDVQYFFERWEGGC